MHDAYLLFSLAFYREAVHALKWSYPKQWMDVILKTKWGGLVVSFCSHVLSVYFAIYSHKVKFDFIHDKRRHTVPLRCNNQNLAQPEQTSKSIFHYVQPFGLVLGSADTGGFMYGMEKHVDTVQVKLTDPDDPVLGFIEAIITV